MNKPFYGSFAIYSSFTDHQNRPGYTGEPGTDYLTPYGTPIIPVDPGVVTFAGWDTTGYGWRVDVDHGNGFKTRYGHLSAVLVNVGDRLSAGQPLGRSGNSGNSEGPHLHLTMLKNGVCVDPELYIDQIPGIVPPPPAPPPEVEIPPITDETIYRAIMTMNLRTAPKVNPATVAGRLDPGIPVRVLDVIEHDNGNIWVEVSAFVALRHNGKVYGIVE